MTSWRIGAAFAVGLAVASPARAQVQELDTRASTPPGAVERPLEVGAGGFVEMGFGQVCQGESDVVTCWPGIGVVGLSLAPRWRLSPLFAVGILGAMGWNMGGIGTMSSDGDHSESGLRKTRVAGELRYHPYGAGPSDLWLGLDIGVSLLTDWIDDFAADGGRVAHASVTRIGPRGGVGLGIDLRTTSFLALSFELRGGTESVGGSEPLLLGDRHAPKYGPMTTLSLGVGGTFLAAP